MLRRLLIVALLAGCAGCATPAVATPPVPAGVVVVTADGATLDDVAQSLPTTLGLRIAAGRPLVPGDVVVVFDSDAVVAVAQSDGSLKAAIPAQQLGSAHHLRVAVAGQTVFDDAVHVVDVTGVMAAEHRDGNTAIVDMVFSNDADRDAVAAAVRPATVTWNDARHARLTWPSGPPVALHIAATIGALHGSHLAGAVDLALTPVPATGVLRRVTVPAAPIGVAPPVTAYTVGTAASRQSLSDNITRIGAVSPTGLRLNGDGSVSGGPDSVAVSVARAHAVRLTPIIQNNASDGSATAALLGSATTRANAVASITAAAVNGPYAGIHLDIEGVSAADRDHLSALVQALADSLHAHGVTLDVDVVPHKPGHLNLYSAAYDIPAIAEHADHVVVMAYDQHTAGTDAGPVDGLDWTALVLDGSLDGVAPSHVILGTALYARTWQGSQAESDAYAPAVSAALSAPGARVDYDFAAATPSVHFTPDPTGGPAQTWFDDAQSLAAKVALAHARGYAGVALWRLGFEDPAAWQLFPSR